MALTAASEAASTLQNLAVPPADAIRSTVSIPPASSRSATTELASYLSDPEVFHCPADHVEFERSGCSYIWNASQSGRHRLRLEFFGKTGDDHRIPLVIDKESWHPGESGVNFLYADMSASSKVQFDVTR